jgi:hypothetical protein
MNTNLRRSIASLLIVSITGLGMPLPAQAGIVSTESAVAADRDRIATMLDRPEVRAQLEARGVNPDDAKTRVAALTDEEVTQLAGRIDSLPAGSGNGGGAIGGVILLAAIVFFWKEILVIGLFAFALVKGTQSAGQGNGAVSKQASIDDSRTGAGQVAEVKH